MNTMHSKHMHLFKRHQDYKLNGRAVSRSLAYISASREENINGNRILQNNSDERKRNIKKVERLKRRSNKKAAFSM